MKIGTIGYVPPPRFKGAQSFLANITKYKTAHELFLYSDHRDYNFHPIKDPENIYEPARIRNPRWAVNNAIFATGVCLALKCGFTHVIYIESDCRVGCPGWDAIIFDEYFRIPFPAIAAGSVVAHACVNGGGKFYERFTEMIANNRFNQRHRIPIYGVPPPAPRDQFPAQSTTVVLPGGDDRYKPAVYPNGALGVYDLHWLAEIFHLNPDGSFKPGFDLINEFLMQPAWDHLLGLRLYDRFGADVFDVVAHMDSQFSSYGDRLTTEADRLQMLVDKKACAVHQIKSNATL